MNGLEINILAFAIPLFTGLIGLEYILSRRMGKDVHQFADSATNVGVGLSERLFDLYTSSLFFYVFTFIYTHFRIFTFEAGFWTFILLFLLTDFVWYWYHRLAHEINLFWGVHVVHHQSEEFNYTVSTRITVFQAIVRGGFWSVLPLAGFPPDMITVLLLVHGAYPFFTHTRLVGKLGWLEYILVTPSHHRVHHASNELYLDKNYGDVLIIWDKLFGTYQEETEEPVYGLTKPLKSYSFLWQHFHFLLEIGQSVRKTSGWWNKVKVVFGPPSAFDPTVRGELEEIFLSRQPEVVVSRRMRFYIIAQLAITSAVLFFLILFDTYWPSSILTGAGAFILLSLINIGAILEKKTWVLYLEYARVSVIILTAYGLTGNQWLLVGLNLASIVFLFLSNFLRKQYVQWVYS
ncbi:sterol desaturase family protein [Siphonobacter aquaeclarae]|uniref:Fatty acid hydroxylase superfamily protein n=1 Tax=Siphonobacter aquaeclarae TaxID=563176 RepID=A0A1G9R5L5_9BACT|nr:sterol desaturase family protein [Siphonobacter aquaeclarae]SDM18400.1 Fatty acid hydroxylase superfamily protein [Siphonobacter aquaeclarae]